MSATTGIDVGSTAVKVLAVRDGRPVQRLVEATGADIARQCGRLLERLGIEGRLCATGYGRELVPGAHLRVSEIMANAVGVGWLRRNWGSLEQVFGSAPVPERLDGRIRTVIDVGGQDSKVITFDDAGLVQDFAMNDRCAAGTGRFLEVMARALQVDLAGLDRLALAADEPARLNSTCTVFAESEVVSLLARGTPPERVAAGLFDSVAAQVAGLAEGCRWRPEVLLDGGPSHSAALRRAVGRRLDTRVLVPPCAQFATALGAALLAAEDQPEEGPVRPAG